MKLHRLKLARLHFCFYFYYSVSTIIYSKFKMKALFLILFVFSTIISFSQVESLSTQIHDVKQIQLKTYELDVKDFTQSIVKNLQQELLGWENKIIGVIYDTASDKLYITHNEQFNDIEFIEVLGKYAMSKKQVLSYN